MKKTSLNIAALALALTLTLILSCGPLFAAQDSTLKLLSDKIDIGTNYNGTSLSMSGTIPEGGTAVIRVVGDRGDKHFKQKGKALGMLWMNLATVSIEDVPGVLLIGLDANSAPDCDADWEKAGLGFQSFEGETDASIFKEFLHLKKNEGLYQVQQGAVTYGKDEDGHRDFDARITLPSALRKGAYEIELFAVRDGKVVASATEEIQAELVGFPALLSSLAFGHSLTYGIMATLIAIMAGLLMTVVFKDRGGAH
ncbi:TIGR02186 family protein [Paucidesulfovibrio longus]|uniref:TIGR02186 family protein n=1 Tax=Paucidesulfovibrio longus TaxID=889 RepID=UPI0003B64771|nr:TIGR02186 family protein [Paucidesulfovibrio longus]